MWSPSLLKCQFLDKFIPDRRRSSLADVDSPIRCWKGLQENTFPCPFIHPDLRLIKPDGLFNDLRAVPLAQDVKGLIHDLCRLFERRYDDLMSCVT